MYIVIELQKTTNSEVSHMVTEHRTLAEAESKFYSILAYAAVSQIPVHSAVIVAEDGNPVKNYSYKHEE